MYRTSQAHISLTAFVEGNKRQSVVPRAPGQFPTSWCLRYSYCSPRGMTSNAHRAYESAAGKSDIKDEYNEVSLLWKHRVRCAFGRGWLLLGLPKPQGLLCVLQRIFWCRSHDFWLLLSSLQVISLGEVRILIGKNLKTRFIECCYNSLTLLLQISHPNFLSLINQASGYHLGTMLSYFCLKNSVARTESRCGEQKIKGGLEKQLKSCDGLKENLKFDWNQDSRIRHSLALRAI